MPLVSNPRVIFFQTGTTCRTVSNSIGTSFVNNFNSNDSTVYNTVGTQYKADTSTVSDASITVTPNPLASMFITPSTDYGTLLVNAQDIVLGNKTTVVSIPGTLIVTYVNSTNVSHEVSLGQFLSQSKSKRV